MQPEVGMSDSPSRARELYLVKEHCDAVIDPQVEGDPALVMSGMREAATKSARDNPDNMTIQGIRMSAEEAYAIFEAAGRATTDELIRQLRSIASSVETEARRLMST